MASRVFLSYSRKDSEFIAKLAEGLQSKEHVVDFDKSSADPNNISVGISSEEAWWNRLEEMILAADAVVLVVSPNSVKSPVCDEEIAFAQAHAKRIIPVLLAKIDFSAAPPRLRALNVKISFDDVSTSKDFLEILENLSKALHLDVHWHRYSARVSTFAERWINANRSEDLLLRGHALFEAREWARRRPRGVDRLSEMVDDYLETSVQHQSLFDEARNIQLARFNEIYSIIRQMLQAELEIRRAMPRSKNRGVNWDSEAEIERIQSVLGLQDRWHPHDPEHVQSTGADAGYAEIYEFSCCGKAIPHYGHGVPSRFRSDGCVEIPRSLQFDVSKNDDFVSQLVRWFREDLRPFEQYDIKPQVIDALRSKS